jgi:hypothetical protein
MPKLEDIQKIGHLGGNPLGLFRDYSIASSNGDDLMMKDEKAWLPHLQMSPLFAPNDPNAPKIPGQVDQSPFSLIGNGSGIPEYNFFMNPGVNASPNPHAIPSGMGNIPGSVPYDGITPLDQYVMGLSPSGSHPQHM